MCYILTLTDSERRAIDWVGDRYPNGYDLYSLLSDCLAPGDAWDDAGDITFNIPEHVAWQIMEENGHTWPCFAPTFAEKMNTFVDNIV